jgi:hypothetical protein
MRTKILPIILPPSMYRQLEREGRAQERDVLQQARWILKRALTDPNDPTATSDPRTAA